MKKFSCLFVLILGLMSVHAQVDSYMIGVYSYSHDFSSTNSNAGISTTIGNSSELLNLLKEYYFNTLQIEDQLFYGPHGKQYAINNPSKSFLDRADSLGMKVLLHCPDISVNQRVDSLYNQIPFYTQYDQNNSNNGLNYYGNHPALAGFAVCDEPTQAEAAAILKEVKKLYPDAFLIAFQGEKKITIAEANALLKK